MRPSNIVVLALYGLFAITLVVEVEATHDDQTAEKTEYDVVVPVLASAVGLLGALLIAVAVFWIIKSRRKLITQKSRLVSMEMKRRRFSQGEVVKMTNNFRRGIGGGGFGSVYHGYHDDAPVAVKISSKKGFQTEVNYLTKVHHKNLINLVGYGNETTKRALVFEFMGNGNLKKHLTGSAFSSSNFLTWERRLGIAIDVAKALDYLHDGCEPPIIHRDIKSSNILLSENFEAKLCEFSLAVDLIPTNDDDSHVSLNNVVGTWGYIDPQYCTTGQLTIGSDVYGFGVVLMEIITGKLANQRSEDGSYDLLTQWVCSMFADGKVGNIVDPKLQGEFDIYALEEALKIAVACVSENSVDRPVMGQVVLRLKQCLLMERTRLNESTSD